mmetsp:Transcript_38745/g.84877  ORF Transcript_38745/g.84877 Transcript_38745/m.84877 type:complete len:242 (+) Transcript_38745:98-823(+)
MTAMMQNTSHMWLASQVRVMMKQLKEVCEKVKNWEEKEDQKLNVNAEVFVPMGMEKDQVMDVGKVMQYLIPETEQFETDCAMEGMPQNTPESFIEKQMQEMVLHQTKALEGIHNLKQRVDDLQENTVMMSGRLEKVQEEANKVQEKCKTLEDNRLYRQDHVEIGACLQDSGLEEEEVNEEEEEHEEDEQSESSSTEDLEHYGFLWTRDWMAISGVSRRHRELAGTWLESSVEHDRELDSEG